MSKVHTKQIKHLQKKLKEERQDKALILSKLRGILNRDIRIKASRKIKTIPRMIPIE